MVFFVEGFYHWFAYFSKDKSKLKKAFEHIFDLKYFYVASEGEKILAMTALTDGKIPCIHFEKKPLKKTLRIFKGLACVYILKANDGKPSISVRSGK